MAPPTRGRNLVLALVLIALGVLVLLGHFTLGVLLGVLGVVLIVVGALVLARVLPGGRLYAVVLLVLGILLELGRVGVPGRLVRVLDLVVGVVLVVMGALRLTR